jgi:hypothetical protein
MRSVARLKTVNATFNVFMVGGQRFSEYPPIIHLCFSTICARLETAHAHAAVAEPSPCFSAPPRPRQPFGGLRGPVLAQPCLLSSILPLPGLVALPIPISRAATEIKQLLGFVSQKYSNVCDRFALVDVSGEQERIGQHFQ